MPDLQRWPDERLVAAVDLGSNSFHVTVAKLTPSGFQVLIRDRERVRLASGMGHRSVLRKKAIKRALETLLRFEARLSGVATEDIQVVATHIFREAKNTDKFLDLASECFRAPINVISGAEEARLIFQAVAHTQTVDGRFLVVDIGGGSTEFSVGNGFDPDFLSSRTLGCATLTDRLMKEVNKDTVAAVELRTRKVIEPIASRIRGLNADTCFGTSGTFKGVSALGSFLGFGSVITRESLEACKKFVLKASNRLVVDIPEVGPDRMQILPAGIGIISAIVDELQLSKIHFCDAALREGVLYGMDHRFKTPDIRERTTFDLVQKYGIDIDQAERLRKTADTLFVVAASVWNLKALDRQLLSWASMLHEIGLNVNYSGYQKHGAYIVMNTPLPGFNREEQTVLAWLILIHRKRLQMSSIPRLRYWSQKRLIRLARLIRVAYAMHVGRDQNIPNFMSSVDGENMLLEFEKNVFKTHRVMFLDLEEEARRQGHSGYSLQLRCIN